MSDQPDRVRVLHVDDDRQFVDVAAARLERENDRIEVATATSAAEGLDHIAETPVDCVVSDYNMPGPDGIEFLEAVREEYPDLPFILFTGTGNEAVAGEAVRAGATDYLRKNGAEDRYALLANRVVNAAEKYAAEREVQEAQQRFRRLLEGSADYVHILDIDGTIQYISPSVERVLGYDPETIVGENALEYIHPDDLGRVEAGMDEVLAEAGAETTVEIRVRNADSEWRWVEVRARNLLEDPAVEGIVANARDISDRRESEAAADWHRTVLHNLGEGVYVYDADYELQFVSHRADIPLDEEDWVGEPVGHLAETGVLTEPEVTAIEDASDAILAGDREEARLNIEPSYPEEAEVVELRLRAVRSPGGEDVVLGTTRDITDRKRRAQQLETLHDVTRQMMTAGTRTDAVSIALDTLEGTLGLSESAVLRRGPGREGVVPADRVDSDAGLATVEPGDGVAWDVYETGETAVVETGEVFPDGVDGVESGLVLPLGEQGVLVAGSPEEQSFDEQTVRVAEVLAANLAVALAEGERSRELEEYEHLVETMGDGVYAIDLDGEYLRLNEAFVSLTGYTRERLLAEGPELVLDDAGVDAFEDAVRALLRAGEGTETVETELYTADRGTVPVEATLTLLSSKEGIRGTVGVVRDISERREREQELERYETIVRAFPDEVYTLDPEGYFTSLIPPAGSEQTTTGYDPEELVGQHASLVITEEGIERGEAVIRELLASESRRTESFELETVTREGERVPQENHIALLSGEDGGFRGTVGVLRNISDRKARERELQRQNERLEKFASFVSHDLRNPLNVASARLELAREDCDSPHLDDIERAHGRMTRLIEAVLTLAREGETPETVEPIAVGELVEQCWAHVNTAAASLVVEASPTVEAERTRLRQLVENLVRNSIEHGGESVTVTVGALEDGFYVADDGPGIPADRREEVFEPGYSTADGGTGLGLNIVKEIAEAHGWTVRATESEGGGARFEFET